MNESVKDLGTTGQHAKEERESEARRGRAQHQARRDLRATRNPVRALSDPGELGPAHGAGSTAQREGVRKRETLRTHTSCL